MINNKKKIVYDSLLLYFVCINIIILCERFRDDDGRHGLFMYHIVIGIYAQTRVIKYF